MTIVKFYNWISLLGPNAKLKVLKAPQWSQSAKTLQKNESQVRKKARRHKDPLSLKTS